MRTMPRSWSTRATIFLWLAITTSTSAAQLRSTPARQDTGEVVTFKLIHAVDDAEQAVFVTGDLPALGGGDVTQAVRLVSHDGTHWKVRVQLPRDRTYTHRYWQRSTLSEDLGDASNGTPLTPELPGRTAPSTTGPGVKRLQVHTSLASPLLHWRQGEDPFRSEPLEPLGIGRSAGEELFGHRAFGTGGRNVEFFLTNHDGTARDPANPLETYVTPLDEFFLQDGELFTYVPAPVVSPMRRDYGSPLRIDSAILGVTRRYRVMLPRGYDEHTARRYPVLYLYDGPVMWDERAPGFGIWDRDGDRMARLVAGGEVGEMIQVAIDAVPDSLCIVRNRALDCVSPEDVVDVGPLCGTVAGMVDVFLGFVASELKPHIDSTYRTLPDREHTFASGYSLGGVYSLYAGWEFFETFGAVAPQSGSFWIPNFPARVVQEEWPEGLRLYLDTGGNEQASEIFESTVALRNTFLLRPGIALDRDLQFEVGHGQAHSYTSGGRRMRSMLTFLWPATLETASLPWPHQTPADDFGRRPRWSKGTSDEHLFVGDRP